MSRLTTKLSRLKIQHVVLASVFLYFILVNADRIHDPDMWWHLKVGEYISDNRTIPTADFYSFSNSGHHWIAHEWGSELLYYTAYHFWQFRGLFAVNILFLTAAYYMFGRLIYARAGRDLSVTTAVLVVCTVFSSLFWVFRPHLLAYLFFLVYLLVLEMYQRGKNLLWVLPPVMIVWVNMHGSFIMGIVLICTYIFSGLFRFSFGRLHAERWAKGQLKTLGVILLVVILAVAVNPNTFSMYYYPFFTLNSEAIVDNITEWSSPDFHHPVFKAFLAYLMLVYGFMMVSKKPVSLKDMVLLGGFTYLAMFGARNIALFMFITGPMLAEHAAGFLSPDRPQKQLPAVNWLALAAVVAYGVYAFPPQMTVEEKVNKENFPVEAVQYMSENNLTGSLFNEYAWGGYLIWTRYPDNRVFIDGRADIYEDRVLPEYMRIVELKPDAYELLLKYDPQYILLSRKAPVNHLLKAKGDWKTIYEDEVASLYGKPAGT